MKRDDTDYLVPKADPPNSGGSQAGAILFGILILFLIVVGALVLSQ